MKYYISRQANGAYLIRQFSKNVQVGWATFKFYQDSVYLIHIETMPKFRGVGYGRNLILHLKKHFSLPILANWRNPKAKAFFEKSGASFSGRSIIL